MKKLYLIVLLLICVSQTSFAQLSNFVLTLDKTDETCTGNASLSFTVTNTVPGSTIIYRIYKLPDVVNSIAVLSGNTFGGLTAGTYRVVSTQTLDESSGTQQQDIIIVDRRVIVTYELTSIQDTCNSGTIIATVLTGTAVTYEIITGPVLVPPQAFNSFTNLPAGTYNIRVIDNCGEGVVQTYTLTFTNPPNLTISSPTALCELESCDSRTIRYFITADNSTTIRYPLTIAVTVFPPGGGTPIVQTQTLTSGDQTSNLITNTIPFYYDQAYSYSIRVTDGCGNVYVRDLTQPRLLLTASAEDQYSHCLNGFGIGLCNYVAPYTVTFLSAPAGFNPLTANVNHPGPFSSSGVRYRAPDMANQVPIGVYRIQVTDACGHTAITQVNIRQHEPLFAILFPPDICEDQYLRIPAEPSIGPLISSAVFISSTADLGHPIPYDVSGNIQSGVLFMQIPPGTYVVQGMDVCGNPYIYTIVIPPREFVVRIRAQGASCAPGGVGNVSVDALEGSRLISIVITQAPSTYSETLPYTAFNWDPTTSQVFTYNIPNLPPGEYVLQITDQCGLVIFRNVTIPIITSYDPIGLIERKGCGDTYDSINLASPNGPLLIVIITAAPASFPFSLPYDVSFNIATNGGFYMNSFPEGSYTFYTKDICDVEKTSTFDLEGYHHGGNIDVLNNCGSFDLVMNFSDNATNQSNLFWLQRLDPLTGQWTHPLTGVVYPPNSLPNTINSYAVNNMATNYNIVAFGTFRVLSRFSYYNNGSSQLISCIQTVKTFDYTGELEIINAYAIPCVNGGSQVFIITNGTPPLDFRITIKDGQPFIVNNGTSNSFANLQPGVYNFRVQDICGNIVNRLLDITTLQQPEIASSNLCEGLSGQLSVQPFSFLNYEWWMGNNTATILSTTNTLTFNPYTSANQGVYHVRIYSTTTNSCVDRVLTYTISPNTLPNAGLDGVRTLCGNSSTLNLFTILNGPYDSGGSWEELTSSGMLVGNNWLPAGLPVGTYTFRYTVNGFCGSSDNSMVNITINPAVDVPVISATTPYCLGDDIEFSVQTIPSAVYQWTGPNNFTSTLQNPTITNTTAANAGVYAVTATVDQCNSSSTVAIINNPMPDYTYETVCTSGVFTVRIIPTTPGSFDPTTATYAWTGPNNFTSTDNPLVLTNQLVGNYNVVVTNSEGCFIPQEINITSTFCDFPNVITPGGDGINDSLDLTNYDVELLQIFSRWGRLVYEKNNYTNQWYGQNMHGSFLPDSTYYYFVKLRNGEEKHGWIFVGRG